MSNRMEHPKSAMENRLELFTNPDLIQCFPALARYAVRLGATPLEEVPLPESKGKGFAKLEWENPTGSIKDRTAFAMIHDLLLTSDTRQLDELHILEYSGGNLAIALSHLCGQLRLKNDLVFGSYVCPDAVAKMQDQGSHTHVVDKDLGFWEVVQTAGRLAENHPDWSYLHQHENPANLRMHETCTGGEISAQLAALSLRATHWIASIGTGGTLIGVHQALSRANPDLITFATTPAELPYGTSEPANGLAKFDGSGGLGEGRKQPFVEPAESNITGHIHLAFDETIAAMRVFEQLTGIWIGSSAAANWLAACRDIPNLSGDSVLAMVFPSRPSPSEQEKAEALSMDDALEASGLKQLL